MNFKTLGFTILIVAVVIGIWFYLQKPATPSKPRFVVTELDMSFIPNDDISDLVYTVQKIQDIGNVAYFTTTSLKTRESSCIEGALGAVNVTKTEIINRLENGGSFPAVKTIGDTGVYYTHPQETCSENKEIQALQNTLIESLKNSLQTAKLVK
jgi:hypothetical protein